MRGWWPVVAVLLLGCPRENAPVEKQPGTPARLGLPVMGVPTRLSYSSTSPRAGTHTFTWTDGGVEMTWRARVGTGALHRRFEPSVGEWNALWAALDEGDAWSSPSRQPEDAPKTEVQLEVADRVVRSAGTSRTSSLVGTALLEMLARADGGVVIGPEAPITAGEGY